jgi:branched-chain amino acid transport system permease protein
MIPRAVPVGVGIGVVVLLALASAILSTYWVRVLTTIYLFAVLACATNLIAGYVGYPAFGNVVFFGLGAYTAGLAMTKFVVPFPGALALCVLVCAAYALVVGLPLLRLRGHYFAIATLGMNEATRAIVDNVKLTGGGMGLSLPIREGDVGAVNRYFYLIILAMLAGVVLVTAWMGRSRFGYGCRAIRFDEEAAASCGVPTTLYKITAWLLSAMFTGLAGGIYAHWFAYIEPAVVFDMSIAVKMFVMMMLGGAGTVLGPVVGAFVVELIGLVAWSRLLAYHTAVLGAVIVVVVIFAPGGLMSLGRILPRRPRPAPAVSAGGR